MSKRPRSHSPSCPPPAAPPAPRVTRAAAGRAETIRELRAHLCRQSRVVVAVNALNTMFRADAASKQAAACAERKKSERLQAQLEAAAKRCDESEGASADAGRLQRELESAKGASAAAETRAETLHDALDWYKEENKLEVAALRKQNEEQTEQHEKTTREQRAEIDRLNEQLTASNTHSAQLKGVVESERLAARAEKEKCGRLQAQLDTAAGQLDQCKAAAQAAAEEEAKRMQSAYDAKQRQYDNALAVVNDQQTNITQLKAEVQRLKDLHEGAMSTESQLHASLSDSEKRASDLLAEKDAACAQRDETNERLESLQRSMDELNKQQTRGEAQAQKKQEAAALLLQKTEQALDAARAEADRLRAELDAAKGACASAGKEADALRKQVDRLNAHKERKAAVSSALSKKQVKKYQKTIDRQRKEIDRLKEKVKEAAEPALKAHIAKLKVDMDRERRAVRTEKSKCTQLQSQLDAQKAQLTALADTAESADRDVRADLDEALGDAERLRRLLSTANSDCATATSEADALQTQIDRINEQIGAEAAARAAHNIQLTGAVEGERRAAQAERDRCGELQARLDEAESAGGDLATELESARGQANTADVARAAAEGRCWQLQKQVDLFKGAQQSKIDALRKLNKELADKHDEVATALRAENARLNGQMAESAKRNGKVAKTWQAERAHMVAQLKAQHETAAKQFDQYKAKVTELSAARGETKRLRTQCDASQGQQAKAQSMVGELQAETARLKAEVQRLKGDDKDDNNQESNNKESVQKELERLNELRRQREATVPAKLDEGSSSSAKEAPQHSDENDNDGGDVLVV